MTTHLPPTTVRRAVRRGSAALLCTVAATVLVAGCGTDGAADATSTTTGELTSAPTPTSEPSASEPSATEPSAAETAARGVPPFPESTRRQMRRPDAAGLVFTDIRVSRRDGFDRIVLRLKGRGAPGWVVNYVDEAVLEGSGEVVDVGGDSVLDIYASGTTAPAPGYYSGPTRLNPRATEQVEGVYVVGTLEGYTQVIAGIDGDPVPFRVFARSSPARLVVDVADVAGD